LFKEGKEIVLYDTIPDLLEKVKQYKDDFDSRMKIAEAGYKRVINEHTFVHRMKEVLSVSR
ncbi:MAG: glycosyltransferase family 1 protein, partial [Nanoarchaeota archaeon]|nr:glycosyltransferase family 1 protein [Nanoarchaeota archaeon]